MNLFSEIKKVTARLFALVAVACPLVVSCYDDSELWEQVNDLAIRVLALEEKLNNELAALNDMLKNNVTITSCTMQSDSTYKIKLSTGVQFVVDPNPKDELKSVVSYMNIGGVNYWAYYNEKGARELFLNAEGERIPVEAETPKVVTKDDESFLVVGGVEYPLSGNSVFSNYEIVQDEMSGEIYAVTFTFGEEMTFTVTVDGAQGFWFVQQTGWNTSILSDYFVAEGMTERVQLSMIGVKDYVLQTPEGWRVKEFVDEVTGAAYFDITAPTIEQVNAGSAESEGYLKVMVALEGGKATVAKLFLSSTPFSRLGVSLSKAYIKAYPGLQKFVYGLCAKADYDEAAIFDAAEKILAGEDVSAGYGYADGSNVIGRELSDILAADLAVSSEYLLWAIPVLLDADSEEFYIKDGSITTHEFTAYAVSFEVISENFKGVDVKFSLEGADAYYADLVVKSDFDVEQIVKWLNYGIYEPLTLKSYTGSAFKFIETDVEAVPSTEYVSWVAVIEEGKTVYTTDDILTVGFKVTELGDGGKVNVVAGEPVAEPTEITLPISAPGAEMIFYNFVKYKDLPNYGDKEKQVQRLLDEGKLVNGSSATVKLSDVFGASVCQPDSDFGFYALAIDADGKYGEVLVAEYSTASIPYNNLDVVLELVSNNPNDVKVKVSTASGSASSYIYWIGAADHSTWTSQNYLGKSAETAESFMAMNPTHTRLTSVAKDYPIVDGVISMTDLALKKEHVVVAVAVDAQGMTSHAEVLTFKTRGVNIGNVVLKSDSKWSAAKPTIEWLDQYFFAAQGQMNGQYGFNISIPAGYTAYVLAGTNSYITKDEVGDLSIISPEDMIETVIEYVDSRRDWHLTVSDNWEWPHIGYVHYHSYHGAPLFGNSMIWASQEYHDSVCDCGGTFDKTTVMQGHEVVVHHIININESGKKFEFRQPQAVGSTEQVVDRVFVVCRDLNGNCYETFVIDVPVAKFQNAGTRD